MSPLYGLNLTFVVPLDTFSGVGVSHTYPNVQVARRAGFEPTSYGLEDRHVLRYTIDAYGSRGGIRNLAWILGESYAIHYTTRALEG